MVVSAEPVDVRFADIFMTALTRYAQGFLTFGALAIGVTAIPVATLTVTRLAHASAATSLFALGVGATLALLVLGGVVTASIGGRLRRTLPAVVASALLALVPFAAAVFAFGALVVFVVPFLIVPLALAPVVAGAGDAGAVGALRRAFELAGGGGYRRMLSVCVVLTLAGLVFFFAYSIAVGPVAGSQRFVVSLLLWALTFGPISALTLRSIYGALTGKLVVRLRST